ncbi:MAG: hypothetical protein ABIH11_07530 [Candidatus Altiarchaeota archaeon]
MGCRLLDTGMIMSKVGDRVVVKTSGNPYKLLNKKAYSKGTLIGRIVDAIGRTNDPCIVVKTVKNVEAVEGDKVEIK